MYPQILSVTIRTHIKAITKSYICFLTSAIGLLRSDYQKKKGSARIAVFITVTMSNSSKVKLQGHCTWFC